MKASDIMNKARFDLMRHAPFFGSICYGVKVIEDDGIPTMCTDGTQIIYSPSFVEKIGPAQSMAVLAHEAFHIVAKHPLRTQRFGESINHKLANMAQDYVINYALKHETKSNGKPVYDLPEEGLYDPRFGNMSWEEVYQILLAESEANNPDGSGEKSGGDQGSGPDNQDGDSGDNQGDVQSGQSPSWDIGGVMAPTNDEGQSLTERELDELETKINGEILKAETIARQAGSVPSCVEDYCSKLIEPEVSWEEVLRRFVGGENPDEYTWRKPNRKMLSNYGYYLPSVIRDGCGDLVIIHDTSKSTENDSPRFYSEINALIDECRPDSVTVIPCDSKVYSDHVREYVNGDHIDGLECIGRGGTDLRPAFDYIEENDMHVDSCVVLSDLYLASRDIEEPDYPVLWVTTGSTDAPFGEVVEVS